MHKVSIAISAAKSGRDFETQKLLEADKLAGDNPPIEDLIAGYLTSTYEAYVASIATENATGLFDTDGVYDPRLFEEWEATYYPFRLTEDAPPDSLMSMMPGVYGSTPDQTAHMHWYRATLECSNVPMIYVPGSAVAQPDSPNCLRYQAIAEAALEESRAALIVPVISTRAYLTAQHMKEGIARGLEKLPADIQDAINALSGSSDPKNNPDLATIEELAQFYMEPVPAEATAPLAKSQLLKLPLEGFPWEQDVAESLKEIRERIEARIRELYSMAEAMDGLPEVRASAGWRHDNDHHKYLNECWGVQATDDGGAIMACGTGVEDCEGFSAYYLHECLNDNTVSGADTRPGAVPRSPGRLAEPNCPHGRRRRASVAAGGPETVGRRPSPRAAGVGANELCLGIRCVDERRRVCVCPGRV